MKRSIEQWVVVIGCVVLAAGCESGGDDPGDAGVVADARAEDDAGEAGDAGPGDAATGDAGAADAGDGGGGACAPGCAPTEACVRGVCIATCDADVSAWDVALAAALTPIVHVCRSAATARDVVEGAAGALRVYELAAQTAGTTTTFTLSRWSLDAAGVASAPETVATTTHEGHAADAIYVGGYLDVSADESGAIYGYTTSDTGFVGGVFDVEVGDGTADELAAPGNYDAAWLDDARWLLDGLGLGGESGQGLYLHDTAAGTSRRVVDGLGDYSGSVAVFGDVVVAGGTRAFGETWPDGTSIGDRVFVIDAAALEGATALAAWDGALAHFEAPSTFEAIGGMRLASKVYDASFMVAGIEARALSEGGSGWTLGAPEPLTTGAAFGGVVAAGESRLLLEHAAGVLVVAIE